MSDAEALFRKCGELTIKQKKGPNWKTYDVRYLSSPIQVSAGLLGRVLSSCCLIWPGA
jgi:hypothetical protein